MSTSSIKYQPEACDILQHLFKKKRINDRTIHFAATFSEHLNLECLKKSVDLSAGAFPLIRCGFQENSGKPYWKDKGYTSDDMVKLIETKDVNSAVWEFLLMEADEINGPQLKIGIIRSNQTDTLCVTINHMICDAAGCKDYLYWLSSIYTKAGKDPNYRPESLTGRRNLGQIMKTFSWAERVRIFAGSNDMKKHDEARFDFEGDLNNPFIELRTVPREKFRRLKDDAKALGATINDVLLTAYIRSLNQYFGHSIALPCSVDLRKYLPGRKAGSICNLVTNLKCDIGPDIGAAFDITLEKVKQEMNRQKTDIRCMKSIWLMEAGFGILPYRIMEKIIDWAFVNPPIAFTNLGILNKEKLEFGENKMTGAFMTGSVKYIPYFQIAVSTFDDVMTLSANLYGTQADRNKISHFLDGMILELYAAI